MSIKLPTSDGMLEMEEVEGLVRIGNTRGNVQRKQSFVVPIIKTLKSNKQRVKWCAAAVVVAILLLILFASDAEEVTSLEEERSHSGMDVEHKNVTVIDTAKQKEPQGEKKIDSDTEAAVTTAAPNENETKDEFESTEPPSHGQSQEPTTEEEPTSNGEEKTNESAADESENNGEEPKEEEEPATNGEEKKEDKKGNTEAPEPETKVDTATSTEPGDNDYCAAFPHRDIPLDQFPAHAWQADPAKVTEYLKNAEKLVDTAISAIHQEYGKELVDGRVDDMFALDKVNFTAGDKPGPDVPTNGGWTTQKSWDGLVRRVLHAMVTSDSFTFVLGGHSAAAGHGNHFKQSYAMQFHKVMEPVFERLGIRLTSRNLAQGGLGTVQSAMAAGSIYGDEMDMIVWDSGMTERNNDHIDLFMRQSLIGGHRVPALWGGIGHIFQMLHENVDADVGQFGTGAIGIPQTENEEQAETLPFAVRYMTCAQERQDLCQLYKFRANCWIPREDVTPPTPQAEKPGSQVRWHPGFRVHQLKGRVLAMTVLQALKEAITKWKAAGDGKLLPESEWHVAEYYENIRSKVKSLDASIGFCHQINGTLPTRMCNTPMKGRTEFTPRADPERTSITSIIKPDADGWVPRVEGKLLYEGPDVYNPMLNVPEGEVDVVAMINSTQRQGRRLPQSRGATELHENTVGNADFRHVRSRNLDEEIVVGTGWEIHDEPPGRCGGEYNDTCGRTAGNKCLLNGHHDNRGGVLGNEYSGWLVMDVPAVKEGIIVLKLETWHFPEENKRTADWKTVNNEPESRRHRLGAIDHVSDSQERQLKRQPEPITDDFVFEFAINGKITSWNRDEYFENHHQVQRVVECFTLLDDPNFTNGKEETVQVAFRMLNCGRHNTFKLTHVYWA